MRQRNKVHHREAPDAATCIRTSTECRNVCLKTSVYVSERGITGLDRQFLANLQTCADICRVCADTMTRGSDLHAIVCGACAEICACCAASCEAGAGDVQLDECRDLCLQCFDVCSAMAAEVV